MPNLITRERAQKNLNLATIPTNDVALVDALIAAASQSLERHCWREFNLTTYDDIYSGGPFAELVLRQYPLVQVDRLASDPRAVFSVQNTSSANQRATVRVTSTGLGLTHVNAGVVTNSTVLFTNAVTLAALATAVTALGNGWTANVPDAGDAHRASADLRAVQGAFYAKEAPAVLELHCREVRTFQVNLNQGVLMLPDGCATWEGGWNAWRVIYQAGYATVPEDVQEACAEFVAYLYWQTKRDPGLAQESVPSVISRAALRDLPASTHSLLAPWRNLRV